ncbi:MAG: hypothetical protein LCH78_09775 [Proteobacteria bacterium]|jgi:hypothetical protein|nr:hypothetical protein [Pseudomonadota bacterium]
MTTPPPSSFKPIVLTDARGVAFLERHPATHKVVTTPSQAGLIETALHFRDGAAVPPDDQWAMPNANVPQDREADLCFENSGHAPPLGFWVTHPDILAWTTSALDDASGDWWVKVWVKR